MKNPPFAIFIANEEAVDIQHSQNKELVDATSVSVVAHYEVEMHSKKVAL